MVNDDLNTPKALALMWEMLKDNKLSDHDKYFLLLEFDKVFGFNLGLVEKEEISKEVVDLVKEREKARSNKDWKKSDKLRGLIESKGYSVSDTSSGWEIKRL